MSPTRTFFLIFLLAASAVPARAQQRDSAEALKRLSLDELMNVEVMSVSRRPERLFETPSAIQVITQDDIRQSGATRLPEALRLASNLQVAQVDARQWAISARGLNGITKDAIDTKGLLVSGGGGSELAGFGSARYGGELGAHANYRIYGKAFSRDPTLLPNGLDAPDSWHMGQGGFRLDWDDSASNRLSLQGDWYDGRIAQAPPGRIAVSGGNVTTRWVHPFSTKSEVTAQAYYDHTHRNIPGTFGEDLDVYDIDVQHRAALSARHQVVWGVGYRNINDHVANTAGLAFLPAHVAREWFTAFAQDEIALAAERLHLTVGAKVEHNDYTGFEVQPSGRLNWTFSPSRTLW